jgi:hypothetical protein
MSRTDSKTDRGRGFSPADAGLKARATAAGSGSEPTGNLDALIDEALRDLTAGAPREGFRARVTARMGTTLEPAPIPSFEILGWRVRSLQLATVGVAAALALLAAFVIPTLFRQAGPKPAETATAAHQPAVTSQPAAVPARPAAPVRHVQAASSPAYVQPHRAAVQQVASESHTRVAAEDTGTFPSVTVDPLSDPRPIVNHAIEIKPVEIQPLVIPEIQVPSLEPAGTGKATGPGK